MRGLVAGALIAAVLVVGQFFGYLRAGIGVAMFFAIALFGVRYVQQMGMVPPEPEVTDMREHNLKYVCRICGLELKLEKASKDRAPTHCMEAMELVHEDGKPPLRPV